MNKERALDKLIKAAQAITQYAYSTIPNSMVADLRRAGENYQKATKEPTHRHSKSGNGYTYILTATKESDLTKVVVYSDADSKFWMRPEKEFKDKFVPISPPSMTKVKKVVTTLAEAFQWKGYEREFDSLQMWIGDEYELVMGSSSNFKAAGGEDLYRISVYKVDERGRTSHAALDINDWVLRQSDGSFLFIKDSNLGDLGWVK